VPLKAEHVVVSDRPVGRTRVERPAQTKRPPPVQAGAGLVAGA